MLQAVIIGLGTFGVRMIEELYETGSEIIIVDKNEEKIEKYKSKAKEAYITDVINDEALKKIVPLNIDIAILDFDDKLEPSIMTTHILHKMGIKNIIVESQSDSHGELLLLAGAAQVIYPEKEAAHHITPMLLSKKLFNYIQLSLDFALAEVEILNELENKKLKDSGFRHNYNLNVVAYRENQNDEFEFINGPDFTFNKNYTILVAGKNKDIEKYIEQSSRSEHNFKKINNKQIF
ncbi:potassium channel family protein [Treponema pedis]|uniref:potassium channel family protein n=1 Tax=Treponema pedis TaxID=409322 RepID=UPI00197E8B7B|nr:TrkA family potassium uptake protein [Treponema pedis]QSI05619.1 TrkA family potassium uptake protein [Treponema pedis]